MNKLLTIGFSILFSASLFATSTVDIFEGTGSLSMKTAPILGTTCKIDYSNEYRLFKIKQDPHVEYDQEITLFKITDAKFVKKIKKEISVGTSRYIQVDEQGNEFIEFSQKQNTAINSWEHLNQYNITANIISEGSHDAMIRLVINLEKQGDHQFSIKNYYVIQGRDTILANCRF